MTNQLKDMQDYAKKRQKGIGAFVNPNVGDVEKGNAMFNNATDVGSAPTSGGMGESVEQRVYSTGSKVSLTNAPDKVYVKDFNELYYRLRELAEDKWNYRVSTYGDKHRIEIQKAVGAVNGSYGPVGGKWVTVKDIYSIEDNLTESRPTSSEYDNFDFNMSSTLYGDKPFNYKGYTIKFHKGYNTFTNMKDYYEVYDLNNKLVAGKTDLDSAKEYIDSKERKVMKTINIREELNKRDMQSCKTDFVNMYESANLSEEKKMQLVKLLSENVSNKKLMEWFDEGNEVKKVYWTAHPSEDDILDSWETLESAIESCKRHGYNYVVSAIERDEDDNRDNWADDWNTEWENPDFKDVFTPEEQEEYGIDAEGNSIDSYDTYHRCAWCEEPTPEARKELYMGWLCPYCVQELISRGEKPVFDDYGAFESLKESKETDRVVKRAKEVIGKLSDIGDASLEVEDVGALKRLRKEIDSLLGKKDLKESASDLISNEEFFNIISKEVDGADIVLGWDKKYHTFNEWVTLLLNTYKDLEQDLLDLGDYEQVKSNRETVINKLLKYVGAHRDLKEEYGSYKDEPYCEEIADDLENGIWLGETYNGTSWELTINGYSSDEFSPSFADYLAEEVAYPVRDGHLAYLGIEMVLYKSSMESIFGYDGLNELIPDLIKLDLDRETIDEWLSSSNPDAMLDFHYDFDIAFDVDEWESNNKDDLPSELTLSIYDFNYVDGETDIDELNDDIGDYLSDEYGYCHKGFQFDVEGEKIYVYDIDWDLSESLNESSQEQYIVEVQPDTEQETFNDYAGALDFYNIRVSDYRKESRNDDVSVALHKVINGEIVDTLEYWKKDESLSEGYSCFEFEEGNPYIAKTEEEKQRLLKKYGDKVKEIKPGFYKVLNKSEDTFLPEDVDMSRYTNTNTNKEPLKPAVFTIEDVNQYDGYDEEYSWNGWACPWFTKEVGEQIASDLGGLMKFDANKDTFVYTYPYEDGSDVEVDYFVGADIETVDGTKHLYPIGNKSWIWDTVEEIDDIDDDMGDFYAVKN